jgi:hypothetical protein
MRLKHYVPKVVQFYLQNEERLHIEAYLTLLLRRFTIQKPHEKDYYTGMNSHTRLAIDTANVFTSNIVIPMH